MARLPDLALRRLWRSRIEDHDGDIQPEGAEQNGGIARWLKLADGLGLDRGYVVSTAGILPGTRHAVDAYVNFVRDRPILDGHRLPQNPCRFDPTAGQAGVEDDVLRVRRGVCSRCEA